MTPGAVRLFVALWPPPAALEEVERTVAGVRTLAPGVRWLAPDRRHLTLTFLGQVPHARREDLEQRLARAVRDHRARHPRPTLRLAGAGRFGDRVLFLALDGDRPGLSRLAASTTAAARGAGLDVEARPYRPHLTVARSTAGADLRPLVRRLTPFEGAPWAASAVELVLSSPGRGAGELPAYTTVASWPLGMA